MGLETFPEIESFQKLPHQVIVKGGSASFSKESGAELRGLVINNIGNPIRQLKVHLVIFDEQKIPIFSTGMIPDPDALPQGAMATFVFKLKDYKQNINDYYLYANWRFDDSV